MREIKTKKEMLTLLRQIGTEEPAICADELDLRQMFEKCDYGIAHEWTASARASKFSLLLYLRLFKTQAGREPKSAYFKAEAASQVEISMFEDMQRTAESILPGIKCIFAFDVVPKIPDGKFKVFLLIS